MNSKTLASNVALDLVKPFFCSNALKRLAKGTTRSIEKVKKIAWEAPVYRYVEIVLKEIFCIKIVFVWD